MARRKPDKKPDRKSAKKAKRSKAWKQQHAADSDDDGSSSSDDGGRGQIPLVNTAPPDDNVSDSSSQQSQPSLTIAVRSFRDRSGRVSYHQAAFSPAPSGQSVQAGQAHQTGQARQVNQSTQVISQQAHQTQLAGIDSLGSLFGLSGPSERTSSLVRELSLSKSRYHATVLLTFATHCFRNTGDQLAGNRLGPRFARHEQVLDYMRRVDERANHQHLLHYSFAQILHGDTLQPDFPVFKQGPATAGALQSDWRVGDTRQVPRQQVATCLSYSWSKCQVAEVEFDLLQLATVRDPQMPDDQ